MKVSDIKEYLKANKISDDAELFVTEILTNKKGNKEFVDHLNFSLSHISQSDKIISFGFLIETKI